MNLYGLLLCLLLILNTTLRFFTNYVNVLPKIFNIGDVIIVFLFLFLFIGYRGILANYKTVFNLFILFNFVSIVGGLLNSDYSYFEAVFSQLIMWNEPIVLFLVLVNLPFSLRDIRLFNNLLFFLLIFEFVVGVMQVPIFLKTGESESIIGTFYGNAEQYAAFLMIGIFYLIGKLKVEPLRKLRYSVIVVAMLILILLIDNKASWIGIALSFFYLLHQIGKSDPYSTQRLKNVFAFSALIFLGFLVINRSSATLYKYAGINQAWQTGNFLNLGKLKAYRDVLTCYYRNPQMLIFGSGPGTFYSRASFQYFGLSDDMFVIPISSILGKKEVARASDSMGNLITKTNMEPYFKTFFLESKIYLVGSATVDSPYNSYAALFGEAGILGALVYLAIYVMVFRRLAFCVNKYQTDLKAFPLIAATLGLLVYMLLISVYNNWLETGRLTTILWSMIAMVLKYDELASCNVESPKY